MAFYNLTNLTSSQSVIQMAQNIDQLAGNHLFGGMFWIVFMVLMYMGFKTTGMEDKQIFAITFWFGAILSLMLQALNLFSPQWTILVMTAALASTLFMFIKSGPF